MKHFLIFRTLAILEVQSPDLWVWQFFLNVIFSKMGRQKYFFDLRFGISVKFRVDFLGIKYEINQSG